MFCDLIVVREIAVDWFLDEDGNAVPMPPIRVYAVAPPEESTDA